MSEENETINVPTLIFGGTEYISMATFEALIKDIDPKIKSLEAKLEIAIEALNYCAKLNFSDVVDRQYQRWDTISREALAKIKELGDG